MKQRTRWNRTASPFTRRAALLAGIMALPALCAIQARTAFGKERTPGAPRTVRYAVLDVASLTTFSDDVAPAINDTGQIAFWSVLPDQSVHASLLANSITQDLGVLPGYGSSISRSVNKRGDVVGWAVSSKNLVDSLATTHAFLKNGTALTDLGTLGGRDSQALGINSRGEVVGVSSVASGDRHAFRDIGGKMTDLGTLPKGSYSTADAINDRGVIAGTSDSGNLAQHAVIWRGGAITDLGTLPGGHNSHAFAIDGRGDVVGFADDARGESHAFLYSGGHMQDLGDLGQDPTRADDINDRGQVVGSSGLTEYIRHAFLWQNGKMSDLNDLIAADSPWRLEEAYAINNGGLILCTGAQEDLKRHLLLLVPVEKGH